MNQQYPLKEISVEITWQCMQKCVHCSSVASTCSRQKLKEDEILGIAKDFKDLGGERIELSGGEPLLHPNIATILPALKEVGLETHIFTCGAIGNYSNFLNSMNEKIRLIRDSGVDKVVFSLHGANARTHDEIVRTEGSFHRAIDFIMGLVKEEITVGLHFVPMTMNFEEFKDLADFASKLGVHDISVLRFVPQGRGKKNRKSLMLREMEVAQLVELLAEQKKRTDIKVKVGSHLDFTFLLDGSTPKPCMAGVTKCIVEANGKVLPCAVFKGMTNKGPNNSVAGNIRNDTLRNIWMTSPIFEKFRAFKPETLTGACRYCDYLSKCKGRCPAQRIYDHKDFYKGPDNYCPKEIFTLNKNSVGSD